MVNEKAVLEKSAKEMVVEVSGWAKALFELVETCFNDMGEFVESVDGRVGDLAERMNLMTGVST